MRCDLVSVVDMCAYVCLCVCIRVVTESEDVCVDTKRNPQPWLQGLAEPLLSDMSLRTAISSLPSNEVCRLADGDSESPSN